jgi:ATP-dependent DNA ligase
MKTVTLYQLATTGKIKHMIITADGNELRTKWFTTSDGFKNPSKSQEAPENFKGKNTGKANATTDEEQTLAEYERKVAKRREEGYVLTLAEALAQNSFVLDVTKALPSEFAPSKPISKTPENPTDGSWLGERKFNGVCLILHNTGNESIIYSRRVKNITNLVNVVPDMVAKSNAVPSKSIVLGELIAIDKNGKEDTSKLKGITNERTTREKAQARYDEMVAEGYTVEFRPYEVLFFKGADVTKFAFEDRNKLVKEIYPKYNREIIVLTAAAVAEAKRKGWEGFILRKADGLFGFDLKGKPKREGAYKLKFLGTTDAIVTKIAAGNGKHSVRFARFYLSQYENGTLVGCGWAGLGTLGEDRADELTAELVALGYSVTDEEVELKKKDLFAVELEYQSRHKENKDGEKCFEFPEIQRTRDDKPLNECIIEDKEDDND